MLINVYVAIDYAMLNVRNSEYRDKTLKIHSS